MFIRITLVCVQKLARLTESFTLFFFSGSIRPGKDQDDDASEHRQVVHWRVLAYYAYKWV